MRLSAHETEVVHISNGQLNNYTWQYFLKPMGFTYCKCNMVIFVVVLFLQVL